MSDNYSTFTDPFSFISVSHQVVAFKTPMCLASTGCPYLHKETGHARPFVGGKDFRTLILVQKAKGVCDMHKLAIVNMALDFSNLDAFAPQVMPPCGTLDVALSFAISSYPQRLTWMSRWSIWKMSGWRIR